MTVLVNQRSRNMRALLTILTVIAMAALPTQTAAGGPPCVTRDVGLGGVGRARVIIFTGAGSEEPVCALVATFAAEGVRARIAEGTDREGALVVAALTPGRGATVIVRDGVLAVSPSGTAPADDPAAVAVGPFVVPPGGGFPSASGDPSAVARVVLAYAGARIVIFQTTPVTVIDLALALRDQPDLFGIDAPERAVILASGSSAALELHTDLGTLGTPVATPRALVLVRRP